MKRWRKWLIALLACLAATIYVVWPSAISFQPSYQGQRLSYWLTGYRSGFAVRATITIGGSTNQFITFTSSPGGLVTNILPVATPQMIAGSISTNVIVVSPSNLIGVRKGMVLVANSTTTPSITPWFTIGGEKPNSVSAAQADEAIRALGARTVPYLVRLLRARDTTASIKRFALLNRQPLIRFEHTGAAVLNNRAVQALSVLGTNAAPAAAELGRLYADPSASSLQAQIAAILKHLGPLGKPATLGLLESLDRPTPNLQTLELTYGVLDAIQADSDVVIARLTDLVDHSTRIPVRANSAMMLGWYGPTAHSAIPVLLKHRHDDYIGDVVRQALREIDPTNYP